MSPAQTDSTSCHNCTFGLAGQKVQRAVKALGLLRVGVECFQAEEESDQAEYQAARDRSKLAGPLDRS